MRLRPDQREEGRVGFISTQLEIHDKVSKYRGRGAGGWGSAYSQRSGSTRNLSDVRGTACHPHHQSTSKAVNAARLISKAVHSITDDDWRTLTSLPASKWSLRRLKLCRQPPYGSSFDYVNCGRRMRKNCAELLNSTCRNAHMVGRRRCTKREG